MLVSLTPWDIRYYDDFRRVSVCGHEVFRAYISDTNRPGLVFSLTL